MRRAGKSMPNKPNRVDENVVKDRLGHSRSGAEFAPRPFTRTTPGSKPNLSFEKENSINDLPIENNLEFIPPITHYDAGLAGPEAFEAFFGSCKQKKLLPSAIIRATPSIITRQEVELCEPVATQSALENSVLSAHEQALPIPTISHTPAASGQQRSGTVLTAKVHKLHSGVWEDLGRGAASVDQVKNDDLSSVEWYLQVILEDGSTIQQRISPNFSHVLEGTQITFDCTGSQQGCQHRLTFQQRFQAVSLSNQLNNTKSVAAGKSKHIPYPDGADIPANGVGILITLDSNLVEDPSEEAKSSHMDDLRDLVDICSKNYITSKDKVVAEQIIKRLETRGPLLEQIIALMPDGGTHNPEDILAAQYAATEALVTEHIRDRSSIYELMYPPFSADCISEISKYMLDLSIVQQRNSTGTNAHSWLVDVGDIPGEPKYFTPSEGTFNRSSSNLLHDSMTKDGLLGVHINEDFLGPTDRGESPSTSVAQDYVLDAASQGLDSNQNSNHLESRESTGNHETQANSKCVHTYSIERLKQLRANASLHGIVKPKCWHLICKNITSPRILGGLEESDHAADTLAAPETCSSSVRRKSQPELHSTSARTISGETKPHVEKTRQITMAAGSEGKALPPSTKQVVRARVVHPLSADLPQELNPNLKFLSLGSCNEKAPIKSNMALLAGGLASSLWAVSENIKPTRDVQKAPKSSQSHAKHGLAASFWAPAPALTQKSGIPAFKKTNGLSSSIFAPKSTPDAHKTPKRTPKDARKSLTEAPSIVRCEIPQAIGAVSSGVRNENLTNNDGRGYIDHSDHDFYERYSNAANSKAIDSPHNLYLELQLISNSESSEKIKSEKAVAATPGGSASMDDVVISHMHVPKGSAHESKDSSISSATKTFKPSAPSCVPSAQANRPLVTGTINQYGSAALPAMDASKATNNSQEIYKSPSPRMVTICVDDELRPGHKKFMTGPEVLASIPVFAYDTPAGMRLEQPVPHNYTTPFSFGHSYPSDPYSKT